MKNETVFVLLAGGKSERMGVAKGLLIYKNTYWILEQLQRIYNAGIHKVFIGLGHNYQHYFKAIPQFKKAVLDYENISNLAVKVVINNQPELESFSTLQAVLKQVPANSNVILNHIDIPILNSRELNKIIASKNELVIPNFEGKNGHPIKMSFQYWNLLLSVNPKNKDAQLDVLIKNTAASKISRIEVSDKSIILNLNTPKEWRNFIANPT